MTGRGAIPKTTVPKKSTAERANANPHEEAQFARSSKTTRTPPKIRETIGGADESIYLCQICLVEDGIRKIQCDRCTLWYHFECAALTEDVLDQDEWMCSKCERHQEGDLIDIGTVNPSGDSSSRVNQKPPNVGHQSTGSKRSGSVTSTKSRRAALAIQKLEEERKLSEKREQEALERQRERDREYLNQKYSILEDDLASNLSFDDEEVNQHKIESVRQWATNIQVPNNNGQLDDDVALIDDQLQLIRPQLNSTIADQQHGMEVTTKASDRGANNVITNIESRSSGIDNGLPPTNLQSMTSSYSQVQLPTWLTNPGTPEPVSIFQRLTTAKIDQLLLDAARNVNSPQVNNQLSLMGDCVTSSAAMSTLSYPTAATQPTILCQQQTASQSTSVSHQSNGSTITTIASCSTNSHVPVGPIALPTFVSNDQIVDQIMGRNRQGISLLSQPVNVSHPQHWSNNRSNLSAGQPQIIFSSHSQVGRPNRTDQTFVNNLSNHASQHVGPVLSAFHSHSQVSSQSQTGQVSGVYQPYVNNWSSQGASQTVGSGVSGVHSQAASTSRPVQSSVNSNVTQTFNANQPYSQAQSFGFGPTRGTAQTFNANQPYSQAHSFGFGPTRGTAQTFNANQPYSQAQSFGFGPTRGTAQTFNANQPYSQSHSFGFVPTSSATQAFNTGQPNNQFQSVGSGQSVGSNNYNQPPDVNNTNGVVDEVPVKLTAEQIAARHVMPTLPAFYGDPLEWQAFISSYENSTETCGYTNSENLCRLQKSLKGDAKTAVQSRLIHKDSVPGVIETLRLLFGRPEQIMEKMISDVQKIPAPSADDLPALIRLAIAVQNLSSTIQNVGEFEHLRNPMLMNAITDKLPTQHRLNWAFYKQTIGNVHVGHLGDWLYQIADVASRVVRVSTGSNKQAKKHKSDEGKKSKNQKSDRDSNPDMSGYVNAQIESTNTKTKSSSESTTKSSRKCPICNESSCQRVKECKKFNKSTPKERWALVKEKELCFRCFGYHQIKKCKSKQKCNVNDCQKAHNPLLHEDEKSVRAANSKTNDDKKNGTTNVNCSHLTINRHVDIFRIVPVQLFHNGKSVRTFAYLDDGSNVTTMENDLADELNLESSGQENLCVRWSFGKIRREELVSRRVSVHISGVQGDAAVYELHNVRTVNDLALPSQTITQEWLDSYEHFKGIPVTPYENAKPRMLIGLQYSKLMVSHKSVEGKWMEPIACKTRLGWIVQGPEGGDDRSYKKSSKAQENFSMNICECERDDSSLHAMIKGFFSWENFGVKITDQILESKDIQRARKILESTTKKSQGRYETGLLWRYDDVKFPETYPMALKRLECLERKMEKDPVLSKKMCDYIQDFLNKGYVRKLTPSELEKKPSRVCYLPMFPVLNPKKPEKFRVVWDAAAIVKKTSLNSMLLAGPDLLVPLPNVLRRFRERPIGITGDMKEMFHQVRVIESDIHAQRFLWRDGKTKQQPEIFVMEVLTFGGKNSPSSAQYVKNKNALEFKNEFPRAVEAITENHYKDDMLESCDSVQEAVRLTEEVKRIHRDGGFELRNFKSNSQKVLEKLGERSNDNTKNLDISSEPVTERVLGMYWNMSTDTFTYSLKYTKIPEDVWKRIRRPSKREVLSAVMSIFDPLGLIAHFMVHGKILLQKIWREGTDWDEKLSNVSYEYWLRWIEDLPKIEMIEIPRWYSPKLVATNRKRIQLHIFTDAGGEACAAAVYYRIEDDIGVDCCLLGAKTKVAPNKPMSMPRLELQAAVLGLKLVNNISECQTIEVTERFFWSDSQTVLGWINSEARKFHQFVAFRVGEILESSTPSEWNYVNTKDNVADDATKWKQKPDLSSTSRWYKAPSFLYQQQDSWMAGNKKAKFSTDEEMRAVYLLAHIEMPNHDIIDTKRFSDWNRLKRIVAYALRFVDNAKLRKKDRRIGPLHRDELVRARNTLVRQAQREDFLDEILVIRNNESLPADKRKELHKSSALRTCSPYLDEEGVLLRILTRSIGRSIAN